MKIYKITDDKIFFMMDSGAYGSIKKEDVDKLVVAKNSTSQSVDARRSLCIIELLNKQTYNSGGEDL
ncbi:hypothetical protein K5Y72_002979 [Escherichia coli]|nr:hypothetical protein [Escherichia coli]